MSFSPVPTALKSVELPRVPTLAWAIPPAEDTTTFPRNPKATPARITGTVRRTDEGFVLTTDGRTVSLVQDMALEGATAAALDALTKHGGRFVASGHKADSKTFEPSGCVFIHRVP